MIATFIAMCAGVAFIYYAALATINDAPHPSNQAKGKSVRMSKRGAEWLKNNKGKKIDLNEFDKQ